MKTRPATQFILLIFISIFAISCKGSFQCYDPELKESMKDITCTTDCPGVTGCNDKAYCNVCEANKEGFRIK